MCSFWRGSFFFFNDTATTEIYTLSLHDALPITFLVTQNLTGYVSTAITNGKYVSYKNGPCPLELIGSTTTVCDLSGKPLSGTPHTVASTGGEYRLPTHIGRF